MPSCRSSTITDQASSSGSVMQLRRPNGRDETPRPARRLCRCAAKDLLRAHRAYLWAYPSASGSCVYLVGAPSFLSYVSFTCTTCCAETSLVNRDHLTHRFLVMAGERAGSGRSDPARLLGLAGQQHKTHSPCE